MLKHDCIAVPLVDVSHSHAEHVAMFERRIGGRTYHVQPFPTGPHVFIERHEYRKERAVASVSLRRDLRARWVPRRRFFAELLPDFFAIDG